MNAKNFEDVRINGVTQAENPYWAKVSIDATEDDLHVIECVVDKITKKVIQLERSNLAGNA